MRLGASRWGWLIHIAFEYPLYMNNADMGALTRQDAVPEMHPSRCET